jgi:hypothetical protein
MMQHTYDTGSGRQGVRRRCGRRALLAAVPLAVMIVAAAAPRDRGEGVEFDDARMIIEFNDTDQDVGIQMFIDGEPWRRLKVFDPDGGKLLDIKAKDSLRVQGLTELFFESSEPSLDEVPLEEFLERFPEGQYLFEGVTIDGEDIEGEATFTHAIPEGPVILSPGEGSVQDPANTVVSWIPGVNPPGPGSEIVAYQVIVTQELDVLPQRTFSVHVPASVTSVTVPAEFMQSEADYEFEVLAIETGGNQTISASFFSTF